jgi:hypothetical protein
LASVRESRGLLLRLCSGICLLLSLVPTATAAQGPDRRDRAVSLAIVHNPNPAAAATEPLQVTWSTGDGSPGAVIASTPGGPETLFPTGPEGSARPPAVGAGSSYVLTLVSIAPRRRALARLRVGPRSRLELLTQPLLPRTSPAAVDLLLEILGFAWVPLALVLMSRYAISLRREA